MENATFATPSLSHSDMHWSQQVYVQVNQATAVIVSAWLEHANTMIQKSESPHALPNSQWRVTQDDLVHCVNEVQKALLNIAAP